MAEDIVKTRCVLDIKYERAVNIKRKILSEKEQNKV